MVAESADYLIVTSMTFNECLTFNELFLNRDIYDIHAMDVISRPQNRDIHDVHDIYDIQWMS